MTAARTIALFRNDIRAMVVDTARKAEVLFNGDADKVRGEIDFRLRAIWKITLDEWDAAQN